MLLQVVPSVKLNFYSKLNPDVFRVLFPGRSPLLKNGSQHYFFLRHFSAHLTARAQLRSWLPHRCAPLLVQHPAPLHSFWSPSSWLAGRRLYLVETHFGERKDTQRRSAHVTAVTRELRNFPGFKPGNCEPTLAEAPRPEQPPPACGTQPHCGNCSRFYWGRRKSSQLDDACSFQQVSEAALKSLCSRTCGSAGQTEQFSASPLTAAPWSADLPTAAKREIARINHR